ncbi:MAG: hypothetical protein QW594_00135 [Candidatus Woesearchaeota archaeon]
MGDEKKKTQEEELFVSIQEHTKIKKELLSELKVSLIVLKEYYALSTLRQQKKELLNELQKKLKEIEQTSATILELMPKTPASHQPAAVKPSEEKGARAGKKLPSAKAAVGMQKKSELELLEEELKAIEEALKKLGS